MLTFPTVRRSLAELLPLGALSGQPTVSYERQGAFEEGGAPVPAADAERPSPTRTFELPELSRAIRGLRDRSEPDFLHLCDSLRAAHREATVLGAETLETIRSVGGQSESSALSVIIDPARESLKDMEKCQGLIRKHADNIQHISDSLKTLNARTRDVVKIGARLKVLAVQVNLESAKIDQDTTSFQSFNTDIRQFSNDVISIGKDIDEKISANLRNQSALVREVLAGEKQLHDLKQNSDRLLNDTIRSVERIMADARKALGKAGDHSRSIAEHVKDIVVAIQFHDNMSQRLSHIIHAVEDLESTFGKTAGLRKENERGWAECYSILRVQEAQLEKLVNEVRETAVSTRNAFDGIAAESEGMSGLLAGLTTTEGLEVARIGKRSDPFVELQEILTHFHGILERGQTLIQLILEKTEANRELGERLASHLVNIQEACMEMRVMSINARLLANRFGDKGRTVSILADLVSDLSRESSVFTGDIETTVASIADLSDTLQLETRRDLETRQGLNERKTALDQGLKALSGEYIRFQSYCLDAAGRVSSLRATIRETEQRLDFFTDLEEGLNRCGKMLRETSAAIRPFFSHDPLEEKEFSGRLRDRYTVHVEHKVHERILSELAPQTNGNTVDDGGGEFGDNVELF